MILFFSVRFEGDTIRHIGNVDYFKEVLIGDPDFAKHEEALIHTCKVALLKKLPDWGRLPDDLVSAHFFYRDRGEETFFFKWEKD